MSKEEPKQERMYSEEDLREALNEIPQFGTKEFNDLASAYFGGKPKQELEKGTVIPHVEKQETPEEAAIFYAHNYFDMHETNNYKALKQGFIEGAKWQQERSYSDEEVYKLTLEALDLGMRIRQDQLSGYSEKSGKELHKEWFEQFKNKQDEQRRT